MQPQTNSRRSFWISMFVIALILVAFVLLIDFPSVIAQLKRSNYLMLALASLPLLLGLCLHALRWQLILDKSASYRLTFAAANIGHLLNLLLPLRAGEAARALTLARSASLSLTQVGSSVVVERLFDQILRLAALGGMLVFGAGIGVSWQSMLGAVSFLGLAFYGLFWLVRHRVGVLNTWPAYLARLPRLSEPKARQGLSEWLDSLASLASIQRLLQVFLVSLLAWIFLWVFHYLILLSLGLALPLEVALALSLGVLALAPPTAPTQPGIYHAAVVLPLSALGLDSAMLTAYAVLLHIVQMVWMVALGLWGFIQSGLSPASLVRGSAQPEGSPAATSSSPSG